MEPLVESAIQHYAQNLMISNVLTDYAHGSSIPIAALEQTLGPGVVIVIVTVGGQGSGSRGQRPTGYRGGHPLQGGAGAGMHSHQSGRGLQHGGGSTGQQRYGGGIAGQYRQQGGGSAGHVRQQGGGDAPHGGGSLQGGGGPPPQHAAGTLNPSTWSNQGFQGMTAQQNLLGTLEQQLHQAVTRAIMQALAGAVPGWGAGLGNAPPSSS